MADTAPITMKIDLLPPSDRALFQILFLLAGNWELKLPGLQQREQL